jgi:hypothetical protein
MHVNTSVQSKPGTTFYKLRKNELSSFTSTAQYLKLGSALNVYRRPDKEVDCSKEVRKVINTSKAVTSNLTKSVCQANVDFSAIQGVSLFARSSFYFIITQVIMTRSCEIIPCND